MYVRAPGVTSSTSRIPRFVRTSDSPLNLSEGPNHPPERDHLQPIRARFHLRLPKEFPP
jgi:hypothetical protein